MADGRRERGAATRERLVEAARSLFGERGYDATPIGAVLARSEVARGALYHHFRSKTELFDAVLEQVMAEITEHTGAVARGGRDPLERMRLGSRAWLRMALDPAIQRISLLDPITVVGWARWRELDERYSLGGLREGFRRLAAEGRIPGEQTELLAYMLLAALNEAALFIALSDDPHAAEEAGRAALDTLLDRVAGPVPV